MVPGVVRLPVAPVVRRRGVQGREQEVYVGGALIGSRVFSIASMTAL